MYEITIENNGVKRKIHEISPDSPYRLSAGQLVEEVNQIPSFSFTVPASNPCYTDELNDRKSIIEMTNTITGETEFEGVLLTHETSMSNSGKLQKSTVCEGFLGYLCDTVQPYHHYEDTTVSQFLFSLLENHNAQTSQDKHIFLGECDFGDDNTNSKTTAYRNTLEEIKVNLTDRIGGEIRVRRVDGKLVLDFLTQYGVKSDTTVELAKNMKSLNVKTDSTNIITRLIPLGTRLDEGETAERLTVSEINDGKPYIDDENAVEKYGIIVGTAEFNDITIPENLIEAGRKYLRNNNRIKKAYSAEVLDLSLIDKIHENLRCGNTYRFRNFFMGLDEDLRLTKRTVDIYKPFAPTVEIGDKAEKITDVAVRTNNLIEYELPKQKSETLATAKAIATSLITNATTGYVVIRPEEILIMDTDDIETATKVWRWNSGGLGYSNTGYNGEYGLAMTMNGQIVADFIAAGYMYADRIRGGTLAVGGADGKDGVIQVLDDSGKEICRLDKNGASIVGSVFSKNSDGYWVRIDNGSITAGRNNDTYTTMDATARITDNDKNVTYNGLNIVSDAVDFRCGMFAVNGKIGQTETLRYVSRINNFQLNTAQATVVTDVWIDENGSLQKATDTINYYYSHNISWDTNEIYFKDGIMYTRITN